VPATGEEVLEALTRPRTDGRLFTLTPHGLRTTQPLRITTPLDLNNVSIDVPVIFDVCSFEHDIDLRGASVKELSLRNCSLSGVNGDGLAVMGNLDFTGSTFRGSANFRNLSTGRDFVLSGARFEAGDDQGVALRATMARIGRGLVVEFDGERRFVSAAQLRFTGATIGGYARFRGAIVNGDKVEALRLDRSTIKGRLFFDTRDEFRCEFGGQVRLNGAQIAGGVEALGAKFDAGPGSGDALTLDGATINGPLITARNEGLESRSAKIISFEANGTVSLNNTTINGDWISDHGLFCGAPGETAISARGMKLNGALVQYSTTRIRGRFDLRAAHVDIIADSRAAWPKKGDLLLDLCTYNSFAASFPTDKGTHVGDRPVGTRKRLDWLNLQPTELRGKMLTAQPYIQLAKVLSASGQRETARYVLYQLEQLRLKRERPVTAYLLLLLLSAGIALFALPELDGLIPYIQLTSVWIAVLLFGIFTEIAYRSSKHDDNRPRTGPVEWVARAAFGGLAGFGFLPFRAVYMLFGLWLTGVAVFSVANHEGLIYPSLDRYSRVVKDIEAMPRANTPAHALPRFDPWLFSADVVIPFVALQQKDSFVIFPANRAPPPSLGPADTEPSACDCEWTPDDPVGWLWTYFRYRVRNGFANSWFAVQTIAAWILGTIAAAGFGGLLRPRED